MRTSSVIKSPTATASLAAAIMIGLLLDKGLQLLVQAAAMPLETAAIHATNAILMAGWRDVMLFEGAPFTMSLFVFTALEGLVLMVLGLVIGMRLVQPVPRARHSK